MNKIKLFFIALKNAYLTVTKEQREAAAYIKDICIKLNIYQEQYNRLDSIYHDLSAAYNQLPKSQRRLYIQQTLDLLQYGFYYKTFKNDRFETVVDCINEKDHYSYLNSYRYFVKELKDIYSSMNNLYKKHKYAEVIEKQKDFNNTIDEFTNTYINDVEE